MKGHERLKGDERILGDSEFVQEVLAHADECYSLRQQYAAQGVDLKTLSQRVADYFDLSVKPLYAPGRYPTIVQARSVLCFLAARQLGVTGTELARKMDLTQPAISLSVKRGSTIVAEKKLRLDDFV